MTEVSVIIPTYNSAHYVTQAIESVIAQGRDDVEIVVVDDGSTDNTAEVVSGYGPSVRYIRQANAGVAAARNRGIAESSGRYVAFLDADDTWLPNKLDRQLAEMQRHPRTHVCFSAFTVVDSDLRPMGVSRSAPTSLEDLLLRGNVVGSICTVVCDRALIQGLGGFDLELSQCADWDMWVRLATQTDFLYVDEPLVTYRQHDSNMSRNAPLLERDSLRVLEKGFAMPALPESLESRRRAAFARNYMVLAGTYFHAGMYADFVRCAAQAVSMDVSQLRYLAGFPVRVAVRALPRRSSR